MAASKFVAAISSIDKQMYKISKIWGKYMNHGKMSYICIDMYL